MMMLRRLYPSQLQSSGMGHFWLNFDFARSLMVDMGWSERKRLVELEKLRIVAEELQDLADKGEKAKARRNQSQQGERDEEEERLRKVRRAALAEQDSRVLGRK
jgi:hypothetical protein